MRYFIRSLVVLMLLIQSVACFGPRTSKIQFSIPDISTNTSENNIYISLDSSGYKHLKPGVSYSPKSPINPDGIRASYMIFFKEGTYKAPISFDQTLYQLSDFYNINNEKSLYGPRQDWGRYSIVQDFIEIEVAVCDYMPDCRLELKTGRITLINDSTLMVNPEFEDNTYIFGDQVKIFYKIDTVDISFIDPSKAWHNQN